MTRTQLCALGLLTLFWSILGRADTSGTIRGAVADTSGAVVQNAKVSVTSDQTGEVRRVVADANGRFEFLLLPVGTYTLRVEETGFATYVLSGIQLAVNQVATFEVKLKPGRSETVVNVEAHTLQVDTATTQLGAVIDSKPIVDLPLNGRNVYQLIALQSGIAVTNVDNGGPALSATSTNTSNAPVPLAFSSGGGRLTMNNFMVDGTDTNNMYMNQAAVQIIPDAVEEFRVLTSTFNAEFGRNSGSVVNVITKSGTNRWHGDLFEFLRNDELNASNFFEVPVLLANNVQESTKASYKLNQFGGTLGGPIVKDKTFVFGSLQISRERRGLPGTPQAVYTDAQRNGDFSADPTLSGGEFTGTLANNLCLPRDSTNCKVFTAGTPYSTIFPSGKIPSSFFDAISQNVLNKFVPLPNDGPALFVATPIQPNDAVQWTVKIDHQFSQNQKFSAFYYFNHNPLQQQATLPGQATYTHFGAQDLGLKDLWILSPKTFNEFGIGFLRTTYVIGPVNAALPSSYGFTGIQPYGPASVHSLPGITIASSVSLGGIGGGGGDFQDTYQVVDHFAKIVGRHALKFGGDYRLIGYVQRAATYDDGFFNFPGEGPNTTGDGFADFVLGLPISYIQGGISDQRLHSHELNFYGQDTWQIQPNLTLNYGLRWELNTPYVETNNELNYVQSPAPGQAPPQSTAYPTAPPGYLFAGDPGVPRGIGRPQYRNFEPRIGLAFSPSWFGPGKIVIRGGYGMFYNPIEQFVMYQINGEPPFLPASSVTAPGFATPFVDQSGTTLPDPFPFVPPAPGTPVDFSPFLPIIQYGELLPTFRSQYVEQYNINIEYQLSRTMVLGAAYVGSQGHRLLASYDANPGNPALCLQIAAELGPVNGCGPGGEDTTYTLPSGQTIYGTRPFGVFAHNAALGLEDYVDVWAINSIAQSAYNSGQFHLQRRGKALQFLASYTFSKSMDNASGFQNPLQTNCYKCDIGLSQFDARHHFILSGTYDLPLKRFAPSGLRQKLIDGWEIGGIYTYQSGNPVYIVDSGDDFSLQGAFDGFNAPDRPDLVGPVHTLNPRKVVCLGGPPCQLGNFGFDPSAFAPNALGTVGTSRHNFFSGPPLNNVDFTAIKHISFGERYSLEFRTEIFNLLNHPQLLNPKGNFSSVLFGQSTAARDPRFIQFAMKLDF